ncbi:reverse transcriptase domain-containing protein [Tanacetum coccineum]
MDDMTIKSRDERMLLADISETFDNLRKINMKLNPKKCSFGVEEGKFLGYMVTSEGIRANPRKTKALADLQSLRTLKEMQSLSGKLASLNRFLAKSAERSPIANTTSRERNPLCIFGSVSRGCKRGPSNRQERKAMPRSVCKQDTERGRKKLCSHGEVGAFFNSHD